MAEPYITGSNLAEKTTAWLEQIAPFNNHPMTLSRSHSALMVIDMQTFFLDPQSPTYTCGGSAITPNIASLIAAFRKAGAPVIYTRHVHNPNLSDAGIMGWWWPGMCLEGSAESEVAPELQPLPTEKQVLKHRYSAFYNTDLETVLRVLKVEDIVITGIMSNMCCESTARDAYFRDYRVFFPADANGSVAEEFHVATLQNLAFGFAHINRTEDILNDIR